MIMTLEQLKKLPSAKNQGVPLVNWNTSGGTKGTHIKDGGELRNRLADGMGEDEIDKLKETKQGRKVMDEYVNDRHTRAKAVEEMSNGVYDHETPKGEMSKEMEVDHHTGDIINE